MSNPGVAVSAMDEANLQGIIYYIKNFKRIGLTCTRTYVEFSKVRAIFHQQDMEESYKEPEVVPTVDTRDWPKTLEKVEEYIRIFLGVNTQPFSYRLREDLIAPVTASDPTYRANISEYFTHD